VPHQQFHSNIIPCRLKEVASFWALIAVIGPGSTSYEGLVEEHPARTSARVSAATLNFIGNSI